MCCHGLHQANPAREGGVPMHIHSLMVDLLVSILGSILGTLILQWLSQ